MDKVLNICEGFPSLFCQLYHGAISEPAPITGIFSAQPDFCKYQGGRKRPPNFIDTGTVFGGTIKLRNAAEALAVSLLIGLPVFHLPVTLTTKIGRAHV